MTASKAMSKELPAVFRFSLWKRIPNAWHLTQGSDDCSALVQVGVMSEA